jgi:hypothetical protein
MWGDELVDWSSVIAGGALAVAALSYWQSRHANGIAKRSLMQSQEVATKQFRARIGIALSNPSFTDGVWHGVTVALANEGSATAYDVEVSTIPEHAKIWNDYLKVHRIWEPGKTDSFLVMIEPEAWFIPIGPYEREPRCTVQINFRDLYGHHTTEFLLSYANVMPVIVSATEDGKPHYQHPQNLGSGEPSKEWTAILARFRFPDRWLGRGRL